MDKMHPTTDAPPSVESAYNDGLSFVEQLCEEVAAGRPIPGTAVFAMVDRLRKAMGEHAPKLIGLTAQPTTTNFLVGHSVNACILSMATARALDYDEETMRDVGAAALLHDVGLTKMVVGQAEQKIQYDKLRGHMADCLVLLRQDATLQHLTAYLNETQMPAHERAATQPSVTPTPTRLSVKQQEIRKVIHLADLYDSLTHSRAEHPSPMPFPAVRAILRAHGLFDQQVVKVFFSQVGIYPIGTWVRLNTGEIGVVTTVHRGFPLRPQVTLYYDRGAGRLVEERMVDLSLDPVLFIKASLEEEPRRGSPW